MEGLRRSNCRQSKYQKHLWIVSVSLSHYLSACLPHCLSVCLTVYLTVCLSVCLSVSLSHCLSNCLSVSLSVCCRWKMWTRLHLRSRPWHGKRKDFETNCLFNCADRLAAIATREYHHCLKHFCYLCSQLQPERRRSCDIQLIPRASSDWLNVTKPSVNRVVF